MADEFHFAFREVGVRLKNFLQTEPPLRRDLQGEGAPTLTRCPARAWSSKIRFGPQIQFAPSRLAAPRLPALEKLSDVHAF
jgi:hypothetical protein